MLIITNLKWTAGGWVCAPCAIDMCSIDCSYKIHLFHFVVLSVVFWSGRGDGGWRTVSTPVCQSHSVFCLGRFCRARRPVPFWWRPALFKKLKWRPALLTKKKTSHSWLLALFCSFCCPHTAWIVLCIFYWAIQGHFWLIMPFFFSSLR